MSKPNAYEVTAWILIAIGAIVTGLILWMAASCQRPLSVNDPAPSCDGTVAECCQRACANVQRLGCPGAEGSPGEDDIPNTDDDVPCWVTCQEQARQVDLGVDLNLGCVGNAKSCEAVEACAEE